MLKFKQNPILWIYTLLSAIVGGAAVSLSSYLGLILANEAGLRVSKPNFSELGIIALSGAITAAVAYLVKSPLPLLEENNTNSWKKEEAAKQDAPKQ